MPLTTNTPRTTDPLPPDLVVLLQALISTPGEASLMISRDRDHGWTISLHLLDETDDGSHISNAAYGLGESIVEAAFVAVTDLT